MTRDKKNIDALFEEGLKGLREKPPVYAWTRLDKGLSIANSKKTIILLRWVAASLLLLLAFGAGYFYATYYNTAQPEIAQENITPVKIENIEPASEDIADGVENKDVQNDLELNTDDKGNQTLLKSSDVTNPEDVIAMIDNSGSSNNNIELSGITKLASLDIATLPEATISASANLKYISTDKKISAGNNQDIAINLSNPYNPFNESDYGDITNIEKQNKWSVGAHFAPVISYRDISTSYNDQLTTNFNETESQLNNAEESLLSYAGGVDVYYNLNDRWSVQSGLIYSRIGQINNDALDFKQENDQYLLFAINTSTGNINVAFEKIPEDVRKINPPKDTLESLDLNNIRVVQNFDLLEIPVMIKYKILNKKLGINISGGLSPAYLLDNNTSLEVNNEKYDIGSSSNLNTMIINTSFGLGINYEVFKKLSLNVEPNFKYSLSPINKDSQFDYHPYYFSVFTGIIYKF